MIAENSLNTVNENEVSIVYVPDKIPEFVTEDYDYLDDKDMSRFITDLERFVRSSYEYRQMVQYLREYMNMNYCAFLPKVSNDSTFKIKIELHHSPFTLHDICTTIFNKRQSLGECLDIEAVAYEVMYVHYCLMVGLIPLSETVHELVHSQYIFVPVDRVYGYYKQFVNQYYNYIDPSLLDKLDELEKLTIEGTYNQMYQKVLEKKYITVDMGANDQLTELHNMQKLLRDRLSELKEDKPILKTETEAIDMTNSAILHPDNMGINL